MSQKTFNKQKAQYLNDLWMVRQGTFNAFLMPEDYLMCAQKHTGEDM